MYPAIGLILKLELTSNPFWNERIAKHVTTSTAHRTGDGCDKITLILLKLQRHYSALDPSEDISTYRVGHRA
jgi:hypothetical protein